MIEKSLPITEKLLVGGLKATEQLYELLTQEAEQLKQRSTPELITRIAFSKRENAGQLDQFTKQLAQVLATEQLSISPGHVLTYFDKADNAGLNTEAARSTWQELSRLGKLCRTLNDQNGASIVLLNRHAQRALSILRGKSPLNTTYGPDGITRNPMFSHSLVSV
jgi:flagellar biosynthesis protein FlgN